MNMDEPDRLRPLLARCPTRLGPVVAVGPGWDAILLSLDSALSALDPDYTISQVKEKHNALCFYYAPSIGVSDEVADRMRRLVSDAEQACSTVCVETGGPGVLMVSPLGWMITMDPLTAPPGWTVARDEPDDLGDVPRRSAISVDDPAELRRLLIEQERQIQHLDGLLQHTLLVVQRLYDALSAKSDTASDGDSDLRGL